MRAKFALALAAVLLLAAGAAFSQSNKPLTNDDVVQMVKGGFDESTTIAAIDSAATNFDTSVQALMALKTVGVSEKVISSMLAATKKKSEVEKPTAVAAAPAAASNPDVPEDMGVYTKLKGSLAEVYAEPVSWKSGGVGKSMLTGGFTKGHVNATVSGPKSKLQLGTPIEFVIKCAEGVTPSEYMLLKLDQKGDRREFRAVTGGVYHSSSGIDKDAIKFDFQKIATRTFKIALTGLKKGEYGFLPPGSGSVGGTGGGASGQTVQGGSMTSGKLYSFGVIE
ncbi:MAG: hypothetical protein AUH11_05115 [Acidobacteria bacterium 13_2_20CM_57_17]|nr:MAG: hypothetical protein AUH11_05115 [Acidobacteria bacterium 13_2_20CM_57_17]OLB92719.1 MAG: hypothetical protein AUI02_07825 [Acidobacteria bacterium 13_2_20CM_2_57_12]OLE17143.1 MAG: hypothetical protein AUG83_00240 [Acidobacteria bacterium 13_1_20CM_4_57_11]